MYETQTISPELMTYEGEEVGLELQTATGWQFLWICCVILSLCYERALVRLTTMDRLNPRLFDVVFVFGILTVLPTIRKFTQLPRVFRLWGWIVATYCVCAVLWVPFFPLYYGKYTIFFALKYIQGLIVIYTVLNIPLTLQQKRILHYMVVLGGVWVAVTAIPEYLRGGVGKTFVTRTGEEVETFAGTLWGTLGNSYFHISMFSSLSSVMTLALFNSSKTRASKLFWLGLGVFVAWPAFFSGCRGGLFTCVLAWLVLFFMSKGSFKTATIIGIMTISTLIFLIAPYILSYTYLSEKSATFARFAVTEQRGVGSSISSRLTANWYNLNLYRWQGWRIPFIGAGFYVAPHSDPDGARHWRPGYGIHNDYLFALEQGGVGAFVLFILFLVACHRNLKEMRRPYNNDADRIFAMGMHSLLYALYVTMLGGQIFWHGFEKANFNSYLIILFMLACTNSWSSSDENADLQGGPAETEGTFIE